MSDVTPGSAAGRGGLKSVHEDQCIFSREKEWSNSFLFRKQDVLLYANDKDLSSMNHYDIVELLQNCGLHLRLVSSFLHCTIESIS